MAKRLIHFRDTDEFARVEVKKGGNKKGGGIDWASCNVKKYEKSVKFPKGFDGGNIKSKIGMFEWLVVIPGLGVMWTVMAPASGALTAAVLIKSMSSAIVVILMQAAALAGMTLAEFVSKFGKIYPKGMKPPMPPTPIDFKKPCPFDDTPVNGGY